MEAGKIYRITIDLRVIDEMIISTKVTGIREVIEDEEEEVDD